MKRIITTGVLVTLALAGTATAAAADPPTDACWGVVSAQAAQLGGLGEHSSSQANPRSGLGNLLRDLGFDSIGEFGAYLATIDGIDATVCD